MSIESKEKGIYFSLQVAFVLLIIFIFPLTASAKSKGLLWFGLGSAEGTYEEKYYGIDDEVEGSTFAYAEYELESRKNNRSLIPSSQGKSKSFFIHYTLFEPTAYDNENRKHKLVFTEVIPNWSRGYTYTIHIGDELDLLTTADVFLGLGIITFEKEIEGGARYDHKFGYDLSYGWSLKAAFKYSDQYFFGWESYQKNNRITLDYGSEREFGYLTHRKDIIIFFGGTFSGSQPNCRETLYVKC